jgi:virulence factor Mce-like protein
MSSPIGGALSRVSNHAYGVAFLLTLALMIGLSVATFQKKFIPVVRVTLMAERIGNQLQSDSDVKVRGLIVGEVRSITSTGNGARIELALQPDQVASIPVNVSARILPKTLFGERYVDLVIPTNPSAQTIAEGDTIGQDRSTVAIELETVFDNLLPLLRTVKPEKLAATLGALANALDGRGTQLGNNLVRADKYFAALNPKMPTIAADISRLADVATTYADAAPDILRMLKALTTTNNTIVAKQEALASFLAGTAGFANTATTFLNSNSDRIIQVGSVQRPTLALAARYAPEYPCFAEGLANWIPRATQMFSDHYFHITLEVVKPHASYQPGEEPAWGEHRGPSCRSLPSPPYSQAHPKPGFDLADGTNGSGNQSPSAFPSAASGLPSYFASPTASSIPGADSGLAGTAGEQQVVAKLLAQDATGARPSAIITLLAGPILRGMTVNQT